MALDVEYCDLGALPGFVESGIRAGAARAGLPTSVGGAARAAGYGGPTSVKGLEKLGVAKAEGLFREGLQKMGAPTNLPFVLPTELTAEGVANAAYATGAKFAEKAIQNATGLPIPFPKKLTAKAIGQAIGSIIPTDIAGALDTALTIGAQAAASGITSLLVGAGIGSAIPGLGTLVGLGVAVAVMEFKKLGKALVKLLGPKQPTKCKLDGKCPTLPPGKNAYQYIAFIDRVPSAFPQIRKIDFAHCSGGPGFECVYWLEQTRERLIRLSLGTAAKMGLFQVRTTLAELTGPTWSIILPAWKTSTDGARLLRELQARKVELERFVSDANRNAVDRWRATTEFHVASVAYQTVQNAETKDWLKFTYDAMARVLNEEAAKKKASDASKEASRAYGQKQIALDPYGAEIKKAQAGCRIGHQPSCAKLKELQAAGPSRALPLAPAPAPKPAVVAMAKRVPPSAPPAVKAAAARVLKAPVVAMAQRVTHAAPPAVKEAARRVLDRASREPQVSGSLIESTKLPEIFQQLFS